VRRWGREEREGGFESNILDKRNSKWYPTRRDGAFTAVIHCRGICLIVSPGVSLMFPLVGWYTTENCSYSRNNEMKHVSEYTCI
jgi:hypothetical protein